MLNESGYTTSRTAALKWAFGCVLAAVTVRITFELERTFMPRKMLKAIAWIGAAAAIGAIGIYATAKPYQRERIWITLRQVVHSNDAQRTEGKNTLASESPNNRVQRARSP